MKMATLGAVVPASGWIASWCQEPEDRLGPVPGGTTFCSSAQSGSTLVSYRHYLPLAPLPVLQGFGQMGYADIWGAVQVGDGAGNLEYAMENPGR